LRRCDILLYKGSGFTSRLIQWGTKSPYSHVAVVVEPKICLGIESNTGHQSGVRAVDLRRLEDERLDMFRVKTEFAFDGDRPAKRIQTSTLQQVSEGEGLLLFGALL